MQLVKCCCNWSFVIGKKQVYGPIYAMGIGTYPTALASTQKLMPIEDFNECYSDCAAHMMGHHYHAKDVNDRFGD